MFLIKIAAGLALIIFGVRFLRKGLDRLLGGQLIVLLERATKNRIQALCAGIVTGVLAPSSTGISLLTAQILGNGKTSTEKMLAVLLGANIGITILANVAALQVGDYAGLLLLLGVIGFQFLTSERIRGIGQCLLSLGFIFLAVNFLSEGASDFGRSHDVGLAFDILDRHPYILCAAAAGLAVLLQSSTATVGLGIGLANGGVLPHSLFITWIVGINIGLGLTSLFVSRSNVEGRRLGLANLFVKILIAGLFLIFASPIIVPSPLLSLPVAQQLALLHTAFNVLAGLLFLPFLSKLLALVKKSLVPDHSLADEKPKSFLNPEALESPSVALAHATRECLRMTDMVKEMFESLWLAHSHGSAFHLKDIRAQDDAVDEINQQLMLYLGQMGDMNHFDRKWHFILLTYANELEAIGDILEKNLAATVTKQTVEHLTLKTEDESLLAYLHQKVLIQFDLAISFMTIREAGTAQTLINAKDEINAWCLLKKKAHYEHLKSKEALSSSLCFLDLLEGLRRVANHLTNAAYGFKAEDERKVKSPRKKPASETSPSPAQTALKPLE